MPQNVNGINIDLDVIKIVIRSGRMPVQRKPRGHYHHGDLRDALVLATLDIVDREGTGAVSLSAAARRVGVSPQASYNHFPDKAALLAAAAEHTLRGFHDAMVVAAAHTRTPGERLERLGVSYVELAAAHPARFRLLSVPELADKRSHPALVAAHAMAFDILVAAIEDCMTAGLVRRSDPRKLAIAAWATVHGVAWLLLEGQLADVSSDATALARDAVRVMFKGLRAR
jgi:AcrR family transcriptional regulator